MPHRLELQRHVFSFFNPDMAALIVLTLLIISAGHTSASTGYDTYSLVQACDETSAALSVTFDGETAIFYDFKNNHTVVSLPDFADPVEIPDLSADASRGENFCKQLLALLNMVYMNPPEDLEPPWTSIYPKTDVTLNTKNTLVCHVTGFFPPPVQVSWTRNDRNVTESATLSPYYHNSDATLSTFSTLSFTPEQGDVYSCTVEHRALEQQQTRIWEVDVQVDSSSVIPSVLCVVGVCLGVIGVAAGIFLIIIANTASTLNTV